MGLKQSKQQFPGKYIMKNDEHYGGSVLFYPYKNTVFQTIGLDQQSIENFLDLIKRRKSMSHPNLIIPMNCNKRQIPQFCSLENTYEVLIEYQYVTHTLEDKISRYCTEKKPFPQKQLRRIFSSVVEALYYLKKSSTCHGDIKPSNIMFDSFDNVKLIDAFFVSGGKTAYEVVLENPSSMSLLSPQQLDTLKKRSYPTIQNVHESQMWSVGLSMLQAMTAQPAMQAYDLKNLTIKKNHFNKKYQQLLSYGYSAEISQLVLSCLKQQHLRPSFSQFLNIIKTTTKNKIGYR